jgi:archaellum component FlaF (FlaF/FlaG flagellin family)
MQATPGFTLVHLYCKSIPASQSKPFQLLIGKQVIFESLDPIDNEYVVIDAEIPEPKFMGSAQFYLGVVIAEKKIDELQHFKLEKGNFVEIKVGKSGLEFTQRENDRFDQPWDGNKIETKKNEEKFDYSSTALDPNLNPKINKKVVEEGPIQSVFFYIQNIPGTYDKPAQLFVDKKLYFTLKTPQPMNKLEVIKVDLPEAKTKVDVRFNIRYDGFDIQQEFDLRNGQHIQFAIIDDGARVAQRSDKAFPNLPFQKQRKYDDVDTQGDSVSESTSGNSGSNGDYVDVTIYAVGVNATSVKKFIVKVNGNVIHKVEKAIPTGQVVVVKGQFQKPKSGDHKINVSALIPACGFFEALEEEFNISKHGRFIKLEVSTKDNDSSCSFAQQHEPFKFNGQDVVQVQDQPKKPISLMPTGVKKVEPTVEVKKSTEHSELDQLEALGDLLKRGILTKEEFDYKKKKILGL